MLQQLNTHKVGYAGLAIGAGTIIIAPVAALFKLLSRPALLVDLYHAFDHLRGVAHHVPGVVLTDYDLNAFAQVAGACVSILGAIVLALLLTYFGMPRTVATTEPDDPPEAPAAPAPPKLKAA